MNFWDSSDWGSSQFIDVLCVSISMLKMDECSSFNCLRDFTSENDRSVFVKSVMKLIQNRGNVCFISGSYSRYPGTSTIG